MTQMSQIQDGEPAAAASERDQQTHLIIGAAMAVHSELGSGFLEPVYQEALALELAERGVPFQRECPMTIQYRGRVLGCSYRADFVCHGDILLELKSQKSVGAVEQAQVLNYLKASGIERALLLNFGAPRLEYRRIVRSQQPISATSASSAVRREER